jgi:hypothetical protein
VDGIVLPTPRLLDTDLAPLCLSQKAALGCELCDVVGKNHVPAGNIGQQMPAVRVPHAPGRNESQSWIAACPSMHHLVSELGRVDLRHSALYRVNFSDQGSTLRV